MQAKGVAAPQPSGSATFRDEVCGNKKKRSGSATAFPEAKRRKLEISTPDYPQIQSVGGSYFAPDDLTQRKMCIVPPSVALRVKLDSFQRENLTLSRSHIHNQGVFLKKDQPALEPFQVAGIYDGIPVRARQLDKQESINCLNSYGRAIKPIVVWQDKGGKGQVSHRNQGYLVCNERIFYTDTKDREIHVGVDGLDSLNPICNINHSEEYSNIIILTCVEPSVIKSATPSTVILKQPPEPTDVCFIAVASRRIEPGEELLLNYGCRDGHQYGTFWGAEQYIFPRLMSVTIQLDFPNKGAFVELSVPVVRSRKINWKKELSSQLRKGASMSDIARMFDGKQLNPLTQQKVWTAGCVQYLCEMLSVPVAVENYQHLSLLCHCQNDEKKLDNNGRNYFSGFVRTQLPLVPPAQQRFETIQEVIDWLDLASEQIRDSVAKEQQWLIDSEVAELRRLMTMIDSAVASDNALPSVITEECDLLTSTDSDDADDVTEEYITNIQWLVISVLQTEPEETRRKDTAEKSLGTDQLRRICYQLNHKFPPPHVIWPEKFIESSWRHTHIRCLPELWRLGIAESTDHDVVSCFRADVPEYVTALQRIFQSAWQSGTQLDMIIKQASNNGFRGKLKLGSSVELYSKPYRIPHLPGIPEALWDTCQWSQLSPEHWQLLGIDTETPCSLKDQIEKFINGGQHSYDSARSSICKRYAHLWKNDETIAGAIKPVIKESECALGPLLNHLAHISKAKYPDTIPKRLHWKAMDTLAMCVPDSEPYNDAMKRFLTDKVAEKKDAKSIASELNKGLYLSMANVAPKDKDRLRIEIPERLKSEKETQWNAKHVEQLMFALNVRCSRQYQLKPRESDALKKIAQEWLDNTKPTETAIKSVFKNKLGRSKSGDAERFAEHLKLRAEKVKTAGPAVMRAIIHLLKIDTSKLSDDLKLFTQLRPGELVNVMAVDHPDRAREIVELIKHFLQKGHTLTFIYATLRDGIRKQCSSTQFDPQVYPGEPSDSGAGEWSYAGIVRLLESHGYTLERLKRDYPCSAECLEMERELCAKSVEWGERDGFIIDRALSPCYRGEKETLKRMREHLPEILKLPNDQSSKSSRPQQLLDRYKALLAQTKNTSPRKR